MKLLVVFVAVGLLGLVSAAPKPEDVTVTKTENEIKEDGSFNTAVELSDGTSIVQKGSIRNPDEPDPEQKVLVVEGEYKYTDAASGQVVNVKYIADDKGYQPTIVSRK
ncbi:unnamed protein product [Allacma fusca]|uniref:Uncharacterized protein n=1 Tax=Allacma fusca TaxID=39272 RepID=A0A8J2KB11_9HEXA|nr:unnamed protein product [Allacma fusca]